MRRAAIEFCKAGYKVIPLRGKKPFWDEWQHKAIADPFDVVELWPGDQYNVGIVCGGGLAVLDVDVTKGGAESFAKLEAELGKLPETRRVRTQSGGFHFYFNTPDGDVSNAAKNLRDRFGPGLDIRGQGGQVVAPGSVYEGRVYTLESDAAIAPIPGPLYNLLCAAPIKSADAAKVIGETDTPRQLEDARAWLAKQPETHEGERDDTAYKVACKLLNLGALDACRELLDEWNSEKCFPPLTEDDLDRIASSARKNIQDAIGRDSFENLVSCFETVEPLPPIPLEELPLFKEIWRYDQTEADEEALPPRPWIAYRRLIRGKLSLMVAPGSIGKSLFSLQWACAIATGNGDWCGLEVRERCDVLVMNNEDDRGELASRLAAVVRHFGLNRRHIWQHVHLRPSNEGRFQLVERVGRGTLKETPRVAELIQYVKHYKIGVIVFDPLVSIHQADENNNVEMDAVCDVLKKVASETGAAIMVVHHTRKPPQASSDSFAGSADAGRGASAVVNAARVALTAFGMSEKDAGKYGIPAKERGRYVRLDDAKANLFLASSEAQWFRRETVRLPSGEESGALRPVELIDKSGAELSSLLSAAAAMLKHGESATINGLATRLSSDNFFEGIGETAAKGRLVAALNMAGTTTYNGKRFEFVPNGKSGGTVTVFEVDPET
jgi:hypothetical protein